MSTPAGHGKWGNVSWRSSCLSLDSAQYLSPDVSLHTLICPPLSLCLPAVPPAYICCVTFGKCCPSLGLKSPLFSFEVYNWVPSAVFSTLQSCFCADQFQLQVSPFSASREKCQAASGENTKTMNRNNALI